jgi:hypothetical protein
MPPAQCAEDSWHNSGPRHRLGGRSLELAEGTFTLSCPEGLPEGRYPVTWGVPFGEGRVFDKSHVRLLDLTGKPVPLQTQVLHTWPDGSLHWLLLDFQAAAANANKTLTLQYGTQVSPTPEAAGLKVAATEQGVTLDEKQKGAAFGVSRYWEMQDILYYYGLWLQEQGGTG